MGRMFGNVGSFWKYLVAGVCLLMGLHLLGVLKLNFPVPAGLRVKKQGYIGAFLLGLIFGVVSTPCAVPILAVLLAFVAEKGNVLYGGFLLFVYALGTRRSSSLRERPSAPPRACSNRKVSGGPTVSSRKSPVS